MRSVLCLAIAVLVTPALAQTGAEGESGSGADMADSACYNQLKETVPPLEQSLSGAERRDLRQLLRPAIILARRGNEAACEAILQEIERIGEQAEGQPAADVEARRAALAGARDIGQDQVLQAQELLDREVVTGEDEEVGEVEDVLITSGEPGRAYVVIDRDGWFQEGAEQVAVPFRVLRITQDGEIVLNAPAEMLEQGPEADPDEMETTADLEEVESYWTERVE